MKALTLTQPWATLVVHGIKTIETRSWRTNYRGWLAIHAAKSFPVEAQELCNKEPFRSFLLELGYIQSGHYPTGNFWFPFGEVIGQVNLVNVAPIPHTEFGYNAYVPGSENQVWLPPSEPELSFGNYTPGRYAWIFATIVRFAEPIPAKGSLGLWEWNYE